VLAWSLAGLAAVLVAATDRDRIARGAAGLVIVAIGVTGLQVGAGTIDPVRLGRVAITAAVPPWFLETNLALIGYGALVAVVGSRQWLVGAAAATVPLALAPLLPVASLPRTGAVLVLLGVVSAVLVIPLGLLRRRFDGAAPARLAARPPAGVSEWVAFLAGVAALVSPWIWVSLAGSMTAWLVALRREASRPARLALGAGALLLAAVMAIWCLSDPPASPEAPASELLSGRFALVAAGALLLPSALGLGAWPCHRLAPGLLLVPGALALAGRFGAEVLPLGLAWWLPVVFPIVILGVVRGLLANEWLAAAGSLAWVGLWMGSPWGRAGAAIVLGAGWLLAFPRTSTGWSGRILLAAAGVGGCMVLLGGLGGEVVYAVLLGALSAAALATTRRVAALAVRS
jgi:hypothetical protein